MAPDPVPGSPFVDHGAGPRFARAIAHRFPWLGPETGIEEATVDQMQSLAEERDEEEFEEPALGSTAVLTAEGWETSDYVPPGVDWSELYDGSFLAPDGTLRSWPLIGSEPF
jgi:hypothetical protein